MKKILLLLVLAVVVFPSVSNAGRTQKNVGHMTELLALAEKREDLLMQAINEITRAQNHGSMMKTTFDGAPMLWRFGSGRFSLNSVDASSVIIGGVRLNPGNKSARRRVNAHYWRFSTLLCESYVRLVRKEKNKSNEFGNCSGLDCDDFESYFERVLMDKNKAKVAFLEFKKQIQPLLERDQLAKKVYDEKLNALFPQYIFAIDDDVVKWKTLRKWYGFKNEHGVNMGNRMFYKKYGDKRNQARLSDEVAEWTPPDEIKFEVNSLKFNFTRYLSRDEAFRATEAFYRVMDGLVESGKAVHSTDGDFDVFMDAEAENGMKGRIILNRKKMCGYWEPAMYSYMGNISSIADKIDGISLKMAKMMVKHVDYAMDKAIAFAREKSGDTVNDL